MKHCTNCLPHVNTKPFLISINPECVKTLYLFLFRSMRVFVCVQRNLQVFIQRFSQLCVWEGSLFFQDSHHWRESVGPLGSLPTPHSVIVSVSVCVWAKGLLSAISLQKMNEEPVVRLHCFHFYFIADGPSFTVYTKRVLLETKTLSCTASHPRVKTLSREFLTSAACLVWSAAMRYGVTVQLRCLAV